MNWDQIQGQWKEYKGKVQSEWGRLTDDEIDEAAGDREQLEGLIQQRYGKAKEEVREEVDLWLKKAS